MHQHRRHHKHAAGEYTLLSFCKNHAVCRVTQIDGGREVTSRLSSMGIFPGVQLTVSNNSGRGPLVVHVMESRVMISRGLADKILVE
ncbi:MAG: ferrous iron transport protein A [Spirochaetales bacterium]|nr:ferrous iron transport protein A [Spirochaetales bacterium]